MKKKGMNIGFIIMVLFLGLTGCQKETVSYNDGEPSGSKVNEQDTSEEEQSGKTLADTLGVEEKWEEKINTEKGETVSVNAEVTVPAVSKLYTMEASEYYYTPEDKKRVAEYFLEAGSIQVDLEAVPTKENIAAEIEKWEKALEDAKETGMEGTVAVINSEKKRKEDMLNEAPTAGEIEADPGDYSQDYYKGSRDGIEFSLGFEIDEEMNQSSWTLSAVDCSSFNTIDAQWFMPKDTSAENKCSMSVEEAEEKAVKLCEELGMEGMLSTGNTTPLAWGDEEEINGYCIVLAREINGVAVSPEGYYIDIEGTETLTYQEKGLERPPYGQETVTVSINDNGIVEMMYSGIMSEGKVGSEVKLLAFEQIKEAFREEIAKNGQGGNYLELIYLRMKDETKDGNYSYIPVWRLGPAEMKNRPDSVVLKSTCTFINAIDGSPVDLTEQGLIYYMDADYIIADYESE